MLILVAQTQLLSTYYVLVTVLKYINHWRPQPLYEVSIIIILIHWFIHQTHIGFLPHTTHWNESESRSVVSDSLQPHGLYSSWNSPSQNIGVGSLSLLQGIFKTQGSNLSQVDSLPAEPWGKSKNTGVGILSLLQQFFPTQELNLGLLHCRRILYQLS